MGPGHFLPSLIFKSKAKSFEEFRLNPLEQSTLNSSAPVGSGKCVTCGPYYKTFWSVIYAISGVFHYDFDWSYADSDVITSKKFYNIGHWMKVF